MGLYEQLKARADNARAKYLSQDQPAFDIIRENAPRCRTRIFLVTVPGEAINRQEVELQARAMMVKFNSLYGGKHRYEIPSRFSPPDDVVGLTGTPARLEAEPRILDGPDTPGKRFLMRQESEIAKGREQPSPQTPTPRAPSQAELQAKIRAEKDPNARAILKIQQQTLFETERRAPQPIGKSVGRRDND